MCNPVDLCALMVQLPFRLADYSMLSLVLAPAIEESTSGRAQSSERYAGTDRSETHGAHDGQALGADSQPPGNPNVATGPKTRYLVNHDTSGSNWDKFMTAGLRLQPLKHDRLARRPDDTASDSW